MSRIKESAFECESYKIDSVRLEMKRNLGMLESRGTIDPKNLIFKVGLRDPFFIKSQNRYIGSLLLELIVVLPKPTNENEIQNEEDALLKINLSITGLFKVDKGRFEPKIEENLAKIQIPAILFPYARSTLSSLLANGGYGSVVLPLVNVQELAKQTPIKVKELDN